MVQLGVQHSSGRARKPFWGSGQVWACWIPPETRKTKQEVEPQVGNDQKEPSILWKIMEAMEKKCFNDHRIPRIFHLKVVDWLWVDASRLPEPWIAMEDTCAWHFRSQGQREVEIGCSGQDMFDKV